MKIQNQFNKNRRKSIQAFISNLSQESKDHFDPHQRRPVSKSQTVGAKRPILNQNLQKLTDRVSKERSSSFNSKSGSNSQKQPGKEPHAQKARARRSTVFNPEDAQGLRKSLRKSGRIIELLNRKKNEEEARKKEHHELYHANIENKDHGHNHGLSHGHSHGANPESQEDQHGHTHSSHSSESSEFDINNVNSSNQRKSKLKRKLSVHHRQSIKSVKTEQLGVSLTMHKAIKHKKDEVCSSHSSMNSQLSNFSSKSPADNDHESHAHDSQLSDIESMSSSDSQEANSESFLRIQNIDQEIQFNKLMKKLIKKCSSVLIQKEVFKFGVDAITSKNYQDDLLYSNKQLKICLQKSREIEQVFANNLEQKKQSNEKLIQSIVYDFEKVKENQLQQKKMEDEVNKKISDQRQLQRWLENAINHNEGEFRVHGKVIIYESKSLNLFRYDIKFRKGVVWLTEAKFFDYFVILLIILGSVCQAMDSQVDYSKNTIETQRIKNVLNQIQTYSAYLFIIEASLKIIAQGLFEHRNSYLKNGWNIVDFLVVLSSIVEIIIENLDNKEGLRVNYLRSIRVIRPLRSVKRLPSMRRLVSIMLRSLPELGNTLVMLLFFFIVFGIVGIQSFWGQIYQRCRLTEEPVDGLWEIDPLQADKICIQEGITTNEKFHSCSQGTYCKSPLIWNRDQQDPSKRVSLDLDEPWQDPIILYNTVNFNNVVYAIMAVFEAITLEGWSVQMIMIQETSTQNNWIAVIFYLLIVIFGSYFILNLILAVIMGSFTKFENQELQEQMETREQAMLNQINDKQITPLELVVTDDKVKNSSPESEKEAKRGVKRKQTLRNQEDKASYLESSENLSVEVSKQIRENLNQNSHGRENENKFDQVSNQDSIRGEIEDNKVPKNKCNKEMQLKKARTMKVQRSEKDLGAQDSPGLKLEEVKRQEPQIAVKDEQLTSTIAQPAATIVYEQEGSEQNLKQLSSSKHQAVINNAQRSINQISLSDIDSQENNLQDQLRNVKSPNDFEENKENIESSDQNSSNSSDIDANIEQIGERQTRMSIRSQGIQIGQLGSQANQPILSGQDLNDSTLILKQIRQNKNFVPKIRTSLKVEPKAIKDIHQNKSSFPGIQEQQKSQNSRSQQHGVLKKSGQTTPMRSKLSGILDISDEENYSNQYGQSQGQNKQANYYSKLGMDESEKHQKNSNFDEILEGGEDQQIMENRQSTFDNAQSSRDKTITETNDRQILTENSIMQTAHKPDTTQDKILITNLEDDVIEAKPDRIRRKSTRKKSLAKHNEDGCQREGEQKLSKSSQEFASMFGQSTKGKKKISFKKMQKRLSETLNQQLQRSSNNYVKTCIFQFFNSISQNYYFQYIILGVITLNTVTLSMDRYPIEPNEAQTLETINKYCTWIFVAELVIKVLGLGIHTYVSDSLNQFDAVVVIISIVEIILLNQEKDLTYQERAENDLTIFRGFRLLRVFRLFRKWKTFHKMIIKIGQTVKDILTFFVLLLIIVFVFSLLGVELFRNTATVNRYNQIVPHNDPQGFPPRQNFNDFFNAFVSVFVCLIGEDWQLVMHDYVRAQRNMALQSYFIVLMIIGNLFLMNLFLAILLKNFEDKKEEHQNQEIDQQEEEAEDIYSVQYLQKSLKLQLRRVFFKQNNSNQQEQKVPNIKIGALTNISPLKFREQESIESSYQSRQPQQLQSESSNPNSNPNSNNPNSNNPNSNNPNNNPNRNQHTPNNNRLQKVNFLEVQNSQRDRNITKEGSSLNHTADNFLEGGSDEKNVRSKRTLRQTQSQIIQKQPTVSSTLSKSNQKQPTVDLASNEGSGSKEVKVISSKSKSMAKSYINIMQQKRKASKRTIKLYDSGKVVKLDGRSLYIFGPDNPFRVFLSKLVVHPYFEIFIFSIVLINGAMQYFDGPLSDRDKPIMKLLDYVDNVFTCIFILELVMKTIAMGFIVNQYSYMRDGWNVLDFLIVVFSVTGWIIASIEDGQGQQFDLFKMLRVLRSLRMISKSEGLKLSVLSLIYSMPGILNVTIVSLLFLILIGIFFLNLFKGQFSHCDLSPDIDQHLERINIETKFDCVNYGGVWRNAQVNFDSIDQAILALFIMCTNEGWVNFMNQANDSEGIGFEPVRNSNSGFQVLFIIYMIFGSLFITNLFIEVVINTFDKEKKAVDRNDRLTSFQKEWIRLQLKCYEVQPIAKINTEFILRKICIKIVQHEYFDPFIMFCIVLNAIVLGLVFKNISMEFYQLLDQGQNILTLIFIIECVLKLIAYQKVYFLNGWNNFDFVVVLTGIVGFQFDGTQGLQRLSVMRILRVLRLLRLLNKAKRLQVIFNSFVHTIPAFINVGGLIMVIIFISSILGNRLFASIMLSGSLDEHHNFQMPGQSFKTLLIAMTGEGWYEIMNDLGRVRDVDYPCIDNPTYKDYKDNNYVTVGCGSPHSIWFFVVYQMLVSLILVNLFIAVTLQGFNEISGQDLCRITDQQIETFRQVWMEVDPEGTGYIHISEASMLMRQLIEKKSDLFPQSAYELVYDPKLLSELIEHLHLKLYKKFQYYNFHDILISLAQMYVQQAVQVELDEIFEEFQEVHKDNFPPEDLDDVIQKIDEITEEKNVQLCRQLEKALTKFKNNVLDKIDRFEGNIYNSSMIPIVIKIQQIFREKRKMRAIEEAEMAKNRNYDRKNLLSKRYLENIDLSESEGSSDIFTTLPIWQKRKQILQKQIKRKLDKIMNQQQQVAVEKEGPTLQELIDKQRRLKQKIQQLIKEELAEHEATHQTQTDGNNEGDNNQNVCLSEEERVKMLKSLDSSSDKTSLKTIKIENYMQLEEHQIKEAIQMYIKYKIDQARFPEEEVKYGQETMDHKRREQQLEFKQQFIDNRRLQNDQDDQEIQLPNLEIPPQQQPNTYNSVPIESSRPQLSRDVADNNQNPFRSVNQIAKQVCRDSLPIQQQNAANNDENSKDRLGHKEKRVDYVSQDSSQEIEPVAFDSDNSTPDQGDSPGLGPSQRIQNLNANVQILNTDTENGTSLIHTAQLNNQQNYNIFEQVSLQNQIGAPNSSQTVNHQNQTLTQNNNLSVERTSQEPRRGSRRGSNSSSQARSRAIRQPSQNQASRHQIQVLSPTQQIRDPSQNIEDTPHEQRQRGDSIGQHQNISIDRISPVNVNQNPISNPIQGSALIEEVEQEQIDSHRLNGLNVQSNHEYIGSQSLRKKKNNSRNQEKDHHNETAKFGQISSSKSNN